MVNNRPVSIGDLARLLLSHARNRESGRRHVLGIAGPPAAGKSTLAVALRDQINAWSAGRVVEVAPMDGFHFSNGALTASGALWRKGAPDTFAVNEFATLLGEARREGAKEISWPTYDRAAHEPVPGGVRFSPETEILIVEGNYLLLDNGGWLAVGDCLDDKWYLDADLVTIEQRLLDRHLKGGKADSAARNKVSTSDLPNAQLVSTTKFRAHLLLIEADGSYYVSGNSPS